MHHPGFERQTMHSESLRKFKHELRTPVNHIIGYSELLLDVARDLGDTAISEQAQNIYQRGRDLARFIEGNLSLSAGHVEDSQMESLRTGIRVMAEDILSSAAFSGAESCEIESCSGDLERIRLAATRLISMAEAGNMLECS
jgi:K+-sensing histidine kinase KdpD